LKVVHVRNLTKTFKKKLPGRRAFFGLFSFSKLKEIKALDRISFDIEKGEILGFLGPNGAGKTTCVRILCGILTPTSGRVRVFGKDPFKKRKEVVRRLGAVFGHRPQLPMNLKARDAVKVHSMYFDIPKTDFENRFEELIKLLGIDHLLERRIRELSLGERMRFEVTASLIHDPELVFLDEPTVGLDFEAKRRIRKFILSCGKTVLFTSHDALDIENICRRIILINQGKIVVDTDIEELKKLIPHKIAEIVCSKPVKPPAGWELRGETVLRKRIKSFSEIERCMKKVRKYEIIDVTVTPPSIEEILLKLYREKK